MARRENDYQADLVKKLKERFPGAFVLKNDPNYIQGIPDLAILYGKRWALLECKRSADEPYRPNQELYLEKARQMKSFSATIYPENEEEVLNELERALGRRSSRKARSSGSE